MGLSYIAVKDSASGVDKDVAVWEAPTGKFSQIIRDQPITQVEHQAISVTSTATALPTTPLTGRRKLSIRNLDAAKTVYLGKDSGVTTATGYPLFPLEEWVEPADDTVTMHGIVASGSVDVRILEIA